MIEAYWDQNLQQARSIDAIWEYTERFEVIWEEMCRKVIAGVSGDASAWPSGRYVGASGEDLGAGLRLVADFVRHVDEHVLVFDAKFYTSDALPDTHSVLKQLAYGFFLSREWHDRGAPSDRIIHVFLLPKHKNLGGHIAHLRGQHLVSPAGRSVALGAPIFLVDLDYGAIASAYLNYTAVDVDLIRRLIVADIAAKKRKE